MIHERRKVAKIVEELTIFFFSVGATKMNSSIEYDGSMANITFQSDFEMENVQIKLKPFNYDRYDDNGGWIPANIMFKDIPNVKISIEGITDLQYNEQDSNDGFFWLYYKIQNLSDTQ